MKHWKRGLCGLLATALMVPVGLAAPVNGEKGLSDLEGHWAQKEVEAAVASGMGWTVTQMGASSRRRASPVRSFKNAAGRDPT